MEALKKRVQTLERKESDGYLLEMHEEGDTHAVLKKQASERETLIITVMTLVLETQLVISFSLRPAYSYEHPILSQSKVNRVS
jgi:hypothetical protein